MNSRTYTFRHPVHGISAGIEQIVVYNHVGDQLVDSRSHCRHSAGRADVTGENRHYFRIQVGHEYLQSLVRFQTALRFASEQSVEIPAIRLR